MARDDEDATRKRFSRSGHTTHHRQQPPPTTQPPPTQPQYPPRQYPAQPPPQRAPRPPDGMTYGDGYERGYNSPHGREFDETTYHSAAPQGGRAKAASRAAAVGTGRAAKFVTRKVIDASKADGANESGLTALIWNQVLSYGTDAMITVALAGTVFFGASANAQRGNVLLYLLVTMAPFAVVAPVIGPMLDRFQHGRRWTMAGTAVGRAVLALIMAAHPTELLVLYPCALGSLVLSKAYSVVRAAAAPRLVPRNLTLTEANARLTLFGLGSTIVFGGFVGFVIKVSGSYSLGLVLTAIAFGVCGFFAMRLPPQVDSAVAASRHPEEPPRPKVQRKVATLQRLQLWAGRGFDPHVVAALQGESALRFLSGLLTIYLAFYVESTQHGLTAALQLGAVVGAAGAGNFSGTAIGTRLKLARPERVIVIGLAIAAGTCVVVALTFNVMMAVVGMYVSAVANALSKIALDALIQRDVVETLRSSAFARSETFLQLAWVFGAAIGVLLPSKSGIDGAIGYWVAAAVTGAVVAVVVLRERALRRQGIRGPAPAGAVAFDPDDATTDFSPYRPPVQRPPRRRPADQPPPPSGPPVLPPDARTQQHPQRDGTTKRFPTA